MYLSVLLAFALAGPVAESWQKELKPLQGEWILIRAETNGNSLVVENSDPKMLLRIKADKWKFMSEVEDKIIAVYSKTNPRGLDLMIPEKGHEGKVLEGIYKLEGDSFTFCWFDGNGRRRPAKFESKDQDTGLLVFKRFKP